MSPISAEETYEKTEENFHKAIDVILAHGEDPSAVRLAWFEGFSSEAAYDICICICICACMYTHHYIRY